jgi:acyl carrier protein
MTNKEKLNHLEELLDIENNTLNEDTKLEDLSEWDSMAIIAVIAMFDSYFEKVITAEEVKRFATVKDIMNKME